MKRSVENAKGFARCRILCDAPIVDACGNETGEAVCSSFPFQALSTIGGVVTVRDITGAVFNVRESDIRYRGFEVYNVENGNRAELHPTRESAKAVAVAGNQRGYWLSVREITIS